MGTINSVSYTKSPLKWSGGKLRMLDNLLPILEMHKRQILVEPFMGSCTVALNYEAEHYFLCDANPDLVNFFSAITSTDKDYLISLCESYFLAGHGVYNEIRDQFNDLPDHSIKRAAMFLYLNKFGFNGLCRYNKKGKFNTPVGKSASPVNLPIATIEECHSILKNAKFSKQDFRTTFAMTELMFKRGDEALIYCDSPYVPLTSNFNYTADGFKESDHIDLKDAAKNSNQTVVVSNHWTHFTKELYSDADEVYTFDVRRSISCSGDNRKKVEECIVVYHGREKYV